MPREFLTDVDLKAGLLLAGSAGSAGQIPTSNGPGVPPTWQSVGASSTVRTDASTAGTIYVGKAPSGSPESGAVWTIIRSTFNSVGIRTAKGTATNVTWTGRAGHSYT